MKRQRAPRDKKRGPGRPRELGAKARGETVKVKPKDEQSCRTRNPKPRIKD